jgi:hypothetical protein
MGVYNLSLTFLLSLFSPLIKQPGVGRNTVDARCLSTVQNLIWIKS